MIRTVLTLTTHTPNQEIVGFYDRHDTLRRSIEEAGGVEAELCESAEDPQTMMVTALWPDEASYQRWVDNPFRASSNDDLAELLGADAVGVGSIYSVLRTTRDLG